MMVMGGGSMGGVLAKNSLLDTFIGQNNGFRGCPCTARALRATF